MSEPRVVHCKREKFDVYIGRPSKWGNPFHLYYEWLMDDLRGTLRMEAKRNCEAKSSVAGVHQKHVTVTFC